MTSESQARARWQASLAALGGLVVGWRVGGKAGSAIGAVAVGLALLAWLAPRAFAPVQRVLDGLSHAILVGFTWFALGVVYFGVFVPIRVWRAFRRRDPLRQSYDPKLGTYLEPLPPGAADRFRRQF